MPIWKKTRSRMEKQEPAVSAVAVQTAQADLGPFSRCAEECCPQRERELYRTLREAIPIVDAAIGKIVRLTGGFRVRLPAGGEEKLDSFLKTVRVNACGMGLDSFLSSYLDQLLTYGTAVGEIAADRTGIWGLYNADLDHLELRRDGPLATAVYVKTADGGLCRAQGQERILVSVLNPRPGGIYGQSLLKGLPFVSEILLKIYNSIGLNWERVGNVRFAVTYKPGSDPVDRAGARERAEAIAREWGKAMRAGGRPSDFVSVGDVGIKVIGADNQVLDSQVPVRQMLEQIVAKLGVPPFLLGLSWSTTERMSAQQADLLTSELEYYRRLLEPVISRICSLWLRMQGMDSRHEIVWDDINLQDEVEHANARLLVARARALEQEQSSGEEKGEEEA